MIRLAVAAVLFAASAAQAEEMVPIPVGWFSDNIDRAPLQALRDKPQSDLTDLERAILTAANRVGWIEIKGCNRRSHAVLIDIAGQDAVVTSRHILAGKIGNDTACSFEAKADFYPDFSYVHPDIRIDGAPTAAGEPTDAVRRHVPLQPGPVNFFAPGLMMMPDEDWLVYFLVDNLSQEPMPDWAFGAGEPRGTMPFSSLRPPSGELFVIGADGRFSRENGQQFTWQKCRFVQQNQAFPGVIYIDCDVAKGASSSLLATLENGALTFQGIVTASAEKMAGSDVPAPAAAVFWNIGTSSAQISEAFGLGP